jgi:K+-sensing histidine kinase KdpD
MIFDRLPLSQNTPANFAAQTRQTVTINHPEKDERMLGIPQNVREAMGKALSTPVMIGQELFGVIAVTRPVNAPDIGAREERMLQTVATQLAIVMQRVKFFDQVQKQAKRESMLNIISQKIQSATTVEAVLQIAARELGHALGAPMTIAQLSMKEKAS